MDKVDQRVFLAFGRNHLYTARAIFRELILNDFFPFLNDPIVYPLYNQDFIESQILARTHFIILLSPSVLDYVSSIPNNFFAEIVFALDHKRNFIVMIFEGNSIDLDRISDLRVREELASCDPILINPHSFETTIETLSSKLSQPVSLNIQPTPKGFQAELSERLLRENNLCLGSTEFILAEQIFEEAYHHQELGQTDEALAVYKRICDINPNFDMVYQASGIIQLQRENFRPAKADLSRSIELYPYDPRTFYHRAITEFLTENYDLAISDFNMAVQLNLNWSEPLIGRAIVEFQLGDPVSALDDIQKALSIQPDSAYALLFRGDIYKSCGDYKEAIIDYSQAIALLPNNASAYINRSQARLASGNLDGALADISQATLLEPSPEYFINLGNLLSSMNDLNGAIQVYTLALEIDPSETDAMLGRANAYHSKGNCVSALSDYSSALNLDPTNFNAYTSRGTIFYEMKNYQAAIIDFSKAIETNPDATHAYIQRGSIRHKLGKLYLAIIDYSSAIDQLLIADNDINKLSWTYCQRASAFFQLGELTRAIQDYQNSLNIAPEERYAIIGMALSHYIQGEGNKAKQFWSQLTQLENHTVDTQWITSQFQLPDDLIIKLDSFVRSLN